MRSMKCLAFTAIVIIIGIVCFKIGYWRGNAVGVGVGRATLVILLSALNDIRSHSVESATIKIETHTYSIAAYLLESPIWKNNIAVTSSVPDLINYRKQYSIQTNKWSVTEVKLEKLLSHYSSSARLDDGKGVRSNNSSDVK